MSTITPAQERAIRAYFAGVAAIPRGLGTHEAACSIGGINVALYGKLTGTIPSCMSDRIGYWIIAVQDQMPPTMRNSAEWRELLPLAAGTGKEHEDERLALILEWLWETVLPHLQPLADQAGFGREWREMCQARTRNAALAAAAAANAANAAAANAALAAATYAATNAAARYAAASERSWRAFDPVGLLSRLIAVGEG